MYRLSTDGSIQNWLAYGPVYAPIDYLDQIIAPDGSPFGDAGRWVLNYWAYDPRSIKLKRKLFKHRALFTWQPGDPPTLNETGTEGQPWRYAIAEQDQTIDFSRFNFRPNIIRGWLFAGVNIPEDAELDAELLTIGPAQVWVNGELQHQFDKTFSYVRTMAIPVKVRLKQGYNTLYIHGLTFGWREQRLALGLRFIDHPDILVEIPIGEIPPSHWVNTEATLNHLQLDRFAITDLPGTLQLDKHAPQPIELDIEATIPLHGSPWAKFGFLEMPTASKRVMLNPGEHMELPLTPEIAAAMSALPGENTLALTIKPADGTPLEMHRHLWISHNSFSHQPYGDYEQRRQEALQHLATMSYDVFAAMAAVETGQAAQIASEAVTIACEFMENRFDCADFYALSLLSLLYRYEHALHETDKQRIEDAFRGFKFWIDEPGLDGMCYFTENHQILFHVTAYLAGQRWKTETFTNSGFTGQQQQSRAQNRIQAWIQKRLQGSYSEWDSNAYMALDIFAMLALVEFASSPRIQEMATTLLHKSFFMLAMQSYRGVHGSTHGRCYVEGLKSARVENTSSLQRIAWGMGIFNGETRATGLLSLAKAYKVPEIIQRMAMNTDDTMTTYARSTESFRPQFDMRGDTWDVRTITRRTSDYMLSAAIDYEPGGRGVQEHLWQATLSPEAVVFTNYPGNNQQHGHARPNFWSGSALLPRVAMHNRCVVCLYHFEENIGLGYSHAYFPTPSFDEWILDGHWVFARYQNGYIALWGDGLLTLTRFGKHTNQELRSSGESKMWLCFVGSQQEDHDFATFRAQVKANTPEPDGMTLQWTTPDGEKLSFGWEGPLTVDGDAVDWETFPHYRNTYTDTAMGDAMMTLREGDAVLQLDLANGRVISPQPESR